VTCPGAWEEDAGHQVALTLAASVPAADKLIALAVALAARLPGTWTTPSGRTITQDPKKYPA
jgi:hypothetical protein